MAKVSFSKLNKIKSFDPIEITIGDQKVEVEQYLPLEKKVELITSVIEQSGNGEEGFFNIVKLNAYFIIEMIKAYTNITFTEKQLEDPTKLYDALRLNDVWAAVQDAIPGEERGYIWSNIRELAREITSYNSSALGIFKSLTRDSEKLNIDLAGMLEEVRDTNSLSLLKDILALNGLTN